MNAGHAARRVPVGAAATAGGVGRYRRHTRPLTLITWAIGQGYEYEEVLQLIVRYVRRLLNAVTAVIMTVEAGGMLLVRAVAGGRVAALRGSYLPMEDTVASEALLRARTLVRNSPRVGGGHDADLATAGLGAVAYAPIPGYGGPVGVLQVACAARRRITADDLRALELFASCAGLRPEPSTHRGLTTTSAAGRPGQELLRRQLRTLAACAAQLCGAAGCAVYVPAGTPREQATVGSLEPVAEYHRPGSRSSALVDGVTAGRLLSRLADRSREYVVERRPLGVMALIPLRHRGDLVGALGASWSRSSPNRARLRSLSAIADAAADTIHAAGEWMVASARNSTDERSHLARRLHDSVTQSLYAITLNARAAHETLRDDPARAGDPIDRILRLAEGGTVNSRRLIDEVQPGSVPAAGLVPALARLLEELRAAWGVATSADLAPEPAVTQQTADVLYLIAREALVNAARHAEPRNVAVRLSQDGPLTLEISDDGLGFEAHRTSSAGLGLRLMEERAAALGGWLDVISAPGAGTLVRVTLPGRAPE